MAASLGIDEKDFDQALKQLLPRGLRPGHPRPGQHRLLVLARTTRLFDGDREVIRELHEEGWTVKDIVAIGVLHQLSGASPDDITGLKTSSNTWDGVAVALDLNVDTFRTYAGIVLGR